MVKEPKNIDFYTTGRQPNEDDFAKISNFIRKSKESHKRKKRAIDGKKKMPAL